MKKSIFFLLLSAIWQCSLSQNLLKRTNYWYFGSNNGVRFTSGSPVTLNNGAMLASEGTAVISDLNGNLLFYTNGVNVWNRNHIMMPGSAAGLWGSTSTSQGQVIVPKPCDSTIYYIFNQEGRSGGGCPHGCGFSYSVVDMKLLGGLGNISSANNSLIGYACEEHAAAVHHANGQDIWAMTHDTSNNFFSFLVTSAGVQPPVITSIAPVANNNVSGYLKFSADGKKVFMGSPGYLFDFDNATGIVSNPLDLGVGICYGASFSPDNSRLYVCTRVGSQVFQFNMLAGTPAQVVASKTYIATIPGGSIYALQQALNGKVYISHLNQGLDVINNPNALGLACNFTAGALAVTGTKLGIPNFVESFFDTSLSASGSAPLANAGADVTICQGATVTLQASGGGTYSWNTGQTSAAIVVTPATGTTYTVAVSSACGSSADSVKVVVLSCSTSPTVTASGNVICPGSCATISSAILGGTAPYAYSWNPGGQTDAVIVVCPTSVATYTVLVTDANNNTGIDTATVSVYPALVPVITGVTSICTGSATTLTASGGINYSWNTGATGTAITVSPTSATSYTLTATHANGCSSSSVVTVTISSPPIVSVSAATVCAGQTAVLTASGGGNYSWSNGANTSSISVAPGSTASYSVIVSVGNCSSSAVTQVIVNPIPLALSYGSTGITMGQSTTLAASGGGNYLWSTGDTGANITVFPTATTVYCITVTNTFGCSDSSCLSVYVSAPEIKCGNVYLPNAFSPNGDGENDVFKINTETEKCLKYLKLILYNRWGEIVFSSENSPASDGKMPEWDGTYSNATHPNDWNPEGTAVFTYYLKATLVSGEEIQKKGNVSLLR